MAHLNSVRLSSRIEPVLCRIYGSSNEIRGQTQTKGKVEPQVASWGWLEESRDLGAQFRPFHFHPGKIKSRHFIGLVELRSPLVIRTFATLKVAVDCAPTQAIGFVIADKYMRTPFGWTTLRAMNALTNANILCGRAGYWAGILNSGVSGSQSVMVPISHRSEIW